MARKADNLPQTPSQTAGPYVHIGTLPDVAGIENVPFAAIGTAIFRPKAKGERIAVTGTVTDGGGMPLTDCLIETWQADAAGLYPGQPGADPQVNGFGRHAADFGTGLFTFETIRPGPVPYPDGTIAAPHISLWIFARGINTGLHTRMYFPGDDHSADPLLARIAPSDRLKTLIAVKDGDRYRFDIHLQGSDETVFFDI
jgi:protocatechuate 3,4-dioxygenase alpha subunit